MISEKDMMHGVDYLVGDAVSGWLMGEKWEGCRAYWDGSSMWSRGGKVIAIPYSMQRLLPAGVPLDGEIHAGRGRFEIARQAVQYNKWVPGIEFSVFDAPECGGTFEDRYAYFSELLPYEGVVNFIQHDQCEGIEDALTFMEDIQVYYGGEGVVLRNPANLYRAGRTDQVLKLVKAPCEC
jgi:DNA ligase-1